MEIIDVTTWMERFGWPTAVLLAVIIGLWRVASWLATWASSQAWPFLRDVFWPYVVRFADDHHSLVTSLRTSVRSLTRTTKSLQASVETQAELQRQQGDLLVTILQEIRDARPLPDVVPLDRDSHDHGDREEQ